NPMVPKTLGTRFIHQMLDTRKTMFSNGNFTLKRISEPEIKQYDREGNKIKVRNNTIENNVKELCFILVTVYLPRTKPETNIKTYSKKL
nr:hypothetical protein [Candidatus Bathyarchaeota archaeon]